MTEVSNPNDSSRYNNLSNSTPTFNLTTKMEQSTEVVKHKMIELLSKALLPTYQIDYETNYILS